jgi:hypothetical protein
MTRSDRAEIVTRALAALARSESLSFGEKVKAVEDELKKARQDVDQRRNQTDTIRPPRLK